MDNSDISTLIKAVNQNLIELAEINAKQIQTNKNLEQINSELLTKLTDYTNKELENCKEQQNKKEEEALKKITEIKTRYDTLRNKIEKKVSILINLKEHIKNQGINPKTLQIYNTILNLENPYKFNGLIWEPSSPRDGLEKKTFIYNDSMNRLVEAGYQRHPSSAEVFSLIIQYFEDQNTDNKVLTPELTKTVEDMLSSTGEWFNQAIEIEKTKKESKLTIYSNVTSINWDGNNYEKGSMKSKKVDIFDITDLKTGDYTCFKNIYKKHNDLIKITHSKKFEELPEKMQENAGIYIPKPGTVWSVGRVGYNDFNISVYNSRASLGVSAEGAETELQTK